MNPINLAFDQWVDDNVYMIQPYELRSRDAVTAAIFLKDRLNVAFRAGYEAGARGEQVPPKCNPQPPEDITALRLQLQAEVVQAKAQLRALEIAHNSLKQDFEAMKEGVKDGR